MVGMSLKEKLFAGNTVKLGFGCQRRSYEYLNPRTC